MYSLELRQVMVLAVIFNVTSFGISCCQKFSGLGLEQKKTYVGGGTWRNFYGHSMRIEIVFEVVVFRS